MRKLVFAMIIILMISAGCDINNAAESETSDISLELVRPVLWEEFDTSDVAVNLKVESTPEIDSIVVFIDGDLMHTFYEEPYEIILQVFEPGTHNIYVVATDVIGGAVSSGVVNFAIELPDVESPVGFITSPADWTTITGIFDVRVSAVDNVGIDKVELFFDGLLVGEQTENPYNFIINSTSYTNENHTIYAKITDTSQNFSLTQLVNIRIDN
jgi:hypothetical protein